MANLTIKQPKKDEKPRKPKAKKADAPVRVKEGDVLMLPSGVSPGGFEVGVVVRVATGSWGEHEVVTEEGRKRRVHKNRPAYLRSVIDKPEFTVVGHDQGWLRMEKELTTKRRKYCDPHRRAAYVKLREEREAQTGAK